MSRRRQRILLRAILTLLITAGVLLLVFRQIDQTQASRYRETREEGTQEFMEEGIIEWNGRRYRKKPATTVILVAGIDQDATAIPPGINRYRNGGQADFLILLAVDHGERQIHQLQIDRDTMAQVMVLGVYGNETGLRPLQICLAHSFGARSEENARYTVQAVSRLMDGLEINGYYMVDYSAIPLLTDALGGVSVTIPEDMTQVNPEWFEGHTLTLRGTDAETFVRTRQNVGEGTNAERMNRQAVYMRSAISRMRERLAEDSSFASSLLSTLRRVAETDLSDQTLLEELGESRDYEILPLDYLQGEYTLAENGYVEFYPEEGSATDWIMTHLYSER